MTQFQYWSQTAGAEVKVTFVGSHIKPDHAVQEIEVGVSDKDTGSTLVNNVALNKLVLLERTM